MQTPHAGHGPAARVNHIPQDGKGKGSADSPNNDATAVPLVRDERVELHPFDGHQFVLPEDRGERWNYVNSAWPEMVVTHFQWNPRKGERTVRVVPVAEGAFDFNLSLRRGDDVVSVVYVHIDCH